MNAPKNSLPPLYAAWAQDIIGAPAPAEPKVTCHDCPMCPDAEGRPRSPGAAFNPRVKCCTYWPPIPNFLAGRALADTDPAAAAGRASMAARIADRRAVTPFGVARPADRPGLESHVAAMGLSERLRCPHYVDEQGGLCGIWNHRHAVCATWFCKHERGAFGYRAWRMLEELFAAAENELALWCAGELGLAPDVLAVSLEIAKRPPELDPPAPAAWAARWGTWAGRECEFYVECARLVSPLSWAEVLERTGPFVATRARVARDSFARAADRSVPARLQLGAHHSVAVGPDRVAAVTYSPYNPAVLPNALRDVLHYFDGRPTAEALDAIRRERGLEIDEPELRMLVDHEILRDAGA